MSLIVSIAVSNVFNVNCYVFVVKMNFFNLKMNSYTAHKIVVYESNGYVQ